jgi:peptidyl-prolyl cis-trans isomerase A (cyclophilin A)
VRRRADRPPAAEALARYTAHLGSEGVLVATLHTSAGEVRCRLFDEKTPVAVANFVGLALGKKAWVDPASGTPVIGRRLYHDLPFHRVIPGFIVQTGDPSGTGRGGPGYHLPDETREDLRHDAPGTLSMVNLVGPDTAGSQFFITLRAAPALDGQHTVFGHCAELGVLERLAASSEGETSATLEAIRVGRVPADRAPERPPPREKSPHQRSAARPTVGPGGGVDAGGARYMDAGRLDAGGLDAGRVDDGRAGAAAR